MRNGSQTKIELLRNVALFSSCSDRELRKIAALADEVEVPAGHVLTVEGEPGSEFFVIAEGKAKVVIGRRKVAALGPGAFVGEMSLLDHGPRVATVTAQSPMRLFVLDARQFSSMLNEVPFIGRKMLKGLAERLREAERSHTH